MIDLSNSPNQPKIRLPLVTKAIAQTRCDAEASIDASYGVLQALEVTSRGRSCYATQLRRNHKIVWFLNCVDLH